MCNNLLSLTVHLMFVDAASFFLLSSKVCCIWRRWLKSWNWPRFRQIVDISLSVLFSVSLFLLASFCPFSVCFFPLHLYRIHRQKILSDRISPEKKFVIRLVAAIGIFLNLHLRLSVREMSTINCLLVKKWALQVSIKKYLYICWGSRGTSKKKCVVIIRFFVYSANTDSFV